jgi:hypothetical protein
LHRYQFPLFFLSSVSEPENSREKIRHMPGKRQAVFVALEILLENLEYLKTRSTWRSRFSRRPTVGIISLVAYSAIFFGLPGTSSIDNATALRLRRRTTADAEAPGSADALGSSSSKKYSMVTRAAAGTASLSGF